MGSIQFFEAKTRKFLEVDEGVRICREVTEGFSEHIACSVCEFENCHMEWTVNYDEYLYCIDGALTLETEEGDFSLHPGDGIWLPNGTWLIYKAGKKATCLAAVYPANWHDLRREQQTAG